jgi:hypothetical protein
MTLVFGDITIAAPNYKVAGETDEQPVYDISIGSSACGSAAPSVQTFTYKHSILPLRVVCLGATPDARLAARNALIAECDDANTLHTKTLVRTVPGATTAETWTILGAIPKRVMRQWDSQQSWFLDIDIYAFPVAAP